MYEFICHLESICCDHRPLDGRLRGDLTLGAHAAHASVSSPDHDNVDNGSPGALCWWFKWQLYGKAWQTLCLLCSGSGAICWVAIVRSQQCVVTRAVDIEKKRAAICFIYLVLQCVDIVFCNVVCIIYVHRISDYDESSRHLSDYWRSPLPVIKHIKLCSLQFMNNFHEGRVLTPSTLLRQVYSVQYSVVHCVQCTVLSRVWPVDGSVREWQPSEKDAR